MIGSGVAGKFESGSGAGGAGRASSEVAGGAGAGSCRRELRSGIGEGGSSTLGTIWMGCHPFSRGMTCCR